MCHFLGAGVIASRCGPRRRSIQFGSELWSVFRFVAEALRDARPILTFGVVGVVVPEVAVEEQRS